MRWVGIGRRWKAGERWEKDGRRTKRIKRGGAPERRVWVFSAFLRMEGVDEEGKLDEQGKSYDHAQKKEVRHNFLVLVAGVGCLRYC